MYSYPAANATLITSRLGTSDLNAPLIHAAPAEVINSRLERAQIWPTVAPDAVLYPHSQWLWSAKSGPKPEKCLARQPDPPNLNETAHIWNCWPKTTRHWQRQRNMIDLSLVIANFTRMTASQRI